MPRQKKSPVSLGLGGTIALLLCGLSLLAYKGSAEIAVNTTTESLQRAPAVAMDGAGNFVAAWVDTAQDGSGDGIYGRVFNK